MDRDWTFSSVWDKEMQTIYACDKESARRANTCLTCYDQSFHITKKASHLVSELSLKFPMGDWALLYNTPGPNLTVLLFYPGDLEKAGQGRGSLWSWDPGISLLKGIVFSSQLQHCLNLRIQVTTKRDYSLFPTFPLILNFP